MAFDDAAYGEPTPAGEGRTAGHGPWNARPGRRLAEAAAAGGLAAVLLVFFWLGLRPDMERAVAHPFFWAKMAFSGLLAAAGYAAMLRLLAHRGPGRGALALAGLAGLVFLIGGAREALQLEPQALARLFTPSWIGACLFNILALALPTLLLSLTMLRGMACERPLAAGFAAGVFSGGLAAAVYGLHCPHASFIFVGLWYAGGVLVCALAGAAIAWLTARAPERA